MKRFALLTVWLAITTAAPAQPPPGLEAALSYPFVADLVAAERADRIAWIGTVKGVRTVWSATGPSFAQARSGARRATTGRS